MYYTQTQLFEIQKAMRQFGGHFVKILADLMDRADAENMRRLQDAFPEYFADYHQKVSWLK